MPGYSIRLTTPCVSFLINPAPIAPMKLIPIAIICTLALTLSCCNMMEDSSGLLPKPQKSTYLQTTQAYFTVKIDKKINEVFSSCTFEAVVSSDLPKPAYSRNIFEMPERESPWVIEPIVEPRQTTLSGQSKNSKNWKHYQGYSVELFIFSDEQRKNQIDYLKQFIRYERPPIF